MKMLQSSAIKTILAFSFGAAVFFSACSKDDDDDDDDDAPAGETGGGNGGGDGATPAGTLTLNLSASCDGAACM